MYRKIVALIIVFGISYAYAQKDSIYAETEVRSFSLGEDTIILKTPKKIILRKLGCSEIITIGEINGREIGMQLELVRSYLGNEALLISGKAFFFKFHDEWMMSTFVLYNRAEFKMIPDESSIKPRSSGLGYGGAQLQMVGKEFYISFRDRYFVFW